MTPGDRALLDEIREAIASARARIAAADAGTAPWRDQAEERQARFIAEWGELILARIAAGTVTLAELGDRRAAVERARAAPWN